MSSKVGGIARAPVWGANPFRTVHVWDYEENVMQEKEWNDF